MTLNSYQLAPQQYDHAAIRGLLPRLFSDQAFLFFCYDHFRPIYDQFSVDLSLADKVARLVTYCQHEAQFARLLPLLRDVNPHQYLEYDPAFRQFAREMKARLPKLRCFISYKTELRADRQLAAYLYQFLTKLGHEVYLDKAWSSNQGDLAQVDQHLKQSDFMIALISELSVDNELLRAEISRANEYRHAQRKPEVFVVRVAYQDLLPYSIEIALSQAKIFTWQQRADHERVVMEMLTAMEQLRNQPTPSVSAPPVERVAGRRRTITNETVISEDGQLLANEQVMRSPLPEFDPRFLEIPRKDFNPQELQAPGGAVRLRDKFYIERHDDELLKVELLKSSGTTTTIRAARQMGKSSLLVRGIHHAQQRGANVVYLDLQGVDSHYLQSVDHFLHHLAEVLVRKLRLNVTTLQDAWQGSLGAKEKLTYFMEDIVLPSLTQPLVLALDEVDLLVQPRDVAFHTDFFSLLRSWHNNRAYDFSGLWDKLYIIMSISTEPYLLIQDVRQSPFNVGQKLYLDDFTSAQVYELNWKHNAPLHSTDFKAFYKLLNGHPYLTRKALYLMVTEGMTWPQLAEVADDDDGPFSDHLLRNYWILVNDTHGLAKALLEIIRHNACGDDLAILRLLKAGLIMGSGNHYSCRCDLYRRYFEGKL